MKRTARMFQAWCVIALVLGASSDLWRAGARAEFTATATTYDLLSLFMARCGPGWVTGDGAFTARLPNGDIAWLFGDAGVGVVNQNSHLIRPPHSTLVVGTTLAIQNASNFFAPEFVSYFHEGTGTVARTTYKGFPYDPINCPKEDYQVPATPSGLVPCTTSEGCFYWPEGAIAEGNQLRMFLVEPHERKTYISSLPIGNYTAPATTPIPTPNNGVFYGHELTNEGFYTYIYGARTETTGNAACHDNTCMHLARVPIGYLSFPSVWQFFAGTTNGQPKWSFNPADTQPITPAGLGPAYSVTKMVGCGTMPTCYVLLQSYSYAAIIASYSANPWGPFSAAKAVHFAFGDSGDVVPEAGMTFGSERGQFVTYSAQLHEEWPPTTDGYLVGYSLNSQTVHADNPLDCFFTHPEDPICQWQHANMYVPRFIRVKFSW